MCCRLSCRHYVGKWILWVGFYIDFSYFFQFGSRYDPQNKTEKINRQCSQTTALFFVFRKPLVRLECSEKLIAMSLEKITPYQKQRCVWNIFICWYRYRPSIQYFHSWVIWKVRAALNGASMEKPSALPRDIYFKIHKKYFINIKQFRK